MTDHNVPEAIETLVINYTEEISGVFGSVGTNFDAAEAVEYVDSTMTRFIKDLVEVYKRAVTITVNQTAAAMENEEKIPENVSSVIRRVQDLVSPYVESKDKVIRKLVSSILTLTADIVNMSGEKKEPPYDSYRETQKKIRDVVGVLTGLVRSINKKEMTDAELLQHVVISLEEALIMFAEISPVPLLDKEVPEVVPLLPENNEEVPTELEGQ